MSEAAAMKYAAEASSSEDEDSGSEEVKVLPHRSTRGKRLAASDDDPEFWQEQGWDDDPDDEEWDNNGESLSELDQFDSDFFESESEEEDGDGLAKDQELLRQDRKKRKHFDYEKVTRARQKRLATSTRVWSLLETAKIGARGKKITQEMMMEEAARNEKATLKQIADRAVLELQQTNAPSNKATRSYTVPNAGQIAVFFSWSSEKTIPNEEMRKSEEEREMERMRGIHERQLYCFTNLAKPKESSFPDMYSAMNTTEIELKRTCNAQYPDIRALYMDPITLTAYNTIEEFGSLRESTRGEDYHSLVTAALSLIPKVQKVVNGS